MSENDRDAEILIERAPEVRVTVDDARAMGYCARGVVAWCRQQRIPWGQVRRDGIATADLIATGEGRAVRLAKDADRAAKAGMTLAERVRADNAMKTKREK